MAVAVQEALGAGVRRRTLYTFVDRLHVPGLFRTFDFPSPDATSPARDATLVPQQALFLMNSPFVLHQARALTARPDVTAVTPTLVTTGTGWTSASKPAPSK